LFILFFHRVNGTRFFTTGQDIVKEISQDFSTHHEKKRGEESQFQKPTEHSMSPARRHHKQSRMTKILDAYASDLGIVIIAAVVIPAVLYRGTPRSIRDRTPDTIRRNRCGDILHTSG
jgi:hypothetical protein